MIRAHLIRLNPTPEQADYFRKACGTARFVFNWALARWKGSRAQGKRVSMHDLKKEFNQIKRGRDEAVRLMTASAVVATSGTEKIACGRRVRPVAAGSGG